MISYEEALRRHNTAEILANPLSPLAETIWAETEVGTPDFWANLKLGILAAFESANGDYVGIVSEYENNLSNQGIVWIYFLPDPTDRSLPEGQESLPVAFGIRDKIWMEMFGDYNDFE